MLLRQLKIGLNLFKGIHLIVDPCTDIKCSKDHSVSEVLAELITVLPERMNGKFGLTLFPGK